MLGWAILFFILALAAGYFAFVGLAGLAATIAQVLFVIFLVMLLLSLTARVLKSRSV